MARIHLNQLGALGLVNDPYESDVPPNAWSRVQNMRFNEKGATSFLGHTKVMESDVEGGYLDPAYLESLYLDPDYLEQITGDGILPVIPTWVKFFPTSDTPRWVYADANKVYVHQDGIHTEITRAAGTYSATERWQGSLYNGLGILNNGFDIPQVWSPIDKATKLVNMSNWPTGYRARFVKPFKNFLIAGFINDGSSLHEERVMWCHPADTGVPTSWDASDPAVDAGFFPLQGTDDDVVDGLDMGELFIVYREHTVWAMQLTGNSRIFRTFDIPGATGILWKDCVAKVPRGHIVASATDLYFHNGSAQSVQSVLDGRTRRWINSRRDSSNYQNSFVVRNAPEKEIWYCFPESGHTYASMALVWNWADGQVGLREMPEVPFADAGPVAL